ncbi:hypothetical protein [Bradyrhizobium macuxiense]|uniref:hypothetical protein n=1 Tax=Bradyrhizobium macuxiense TaxID=1755647 RepID=UPI0010A96553|nr:hypothetical protein [Bradyrhizobium macuxiense]
MINLDQVVDNVIRVGKVWYESHTIDDAIAFILEGFEPLARLRKGVWRAEIYKQSIGQRECIAQTGQIALDASSFRLTILTRSWRLIPRQA